jgi:hypothetical protein
MGSRLTKLTKIRPIVARGYKIRISVDQVDQNGTNCYQGSTLGSGFYKLTKMRLVVARGDKIIIRVDQVDQKRTNC